MKYSAVIALLMLSLEANAKGFFAGYDLGEMAFTSSNKFRNNIWLNIGIKF